MKYQYAKAEKPSEYTVETGLGLGAKDQRTLAKDIPCQAACPAKTNVPAYIEALAAGDPDAAYRINLEDNVFPGALGRICTRPCQDACRHNWTNTAGPVQICHLKRSGADGRTAAARPLPAWFGPSGKRVAVVGGGPAGLTAARELARYGHAVTVFERRPYLGGMMVDGIPRFRLPLAVVESEIGLIVDSGISVELGRPVGAAELLELERGFDAVLVATGTTAARALAFDAAPPDPAGPALADAAAIAALPPGSLLAGLDFMRDYNAGRVPALEGDVVVVGGGFTAVDCARASARAAKRILGEGGAVTIMYRRTERHLAADLEELAEIRAENIGVRTLVSPVGLVVEDGRLAGVRFVRNRLEQRGQPAKPVAVPIPGSQFTLPCRTLVVAIGQEADRSLLPAGLAPSAEGLPERPKLFAAGEFLGGSSDVIHAVADGKAAAAAIDRFLSGGAVRVKRHVAVELIAGDGETGRQRAHDLQTPPAVSLRAVVDRLRADAEVEGGIPPADLPAAATRCYFCHYKFSIDNDKCIHCDWCIEVAPRACIKKVSRVFADADGFVEDYTETDSSARASFIHIDSQECIRCGKCLRVCPVGAITMRKATLTACASDPAQAAGWRPLQ